MTVHCGVNLNMGHISVIYIRGVYVGPVGHKIFLRMQWVSRWRALMQPLEGLVEAYADGTRHLQLQLDPSLLFVGALLAIVQKMFVPEQPASTQAWCSTQA